MAIISYVGTELNPANSTFQDWLTKTNEIITDMGSSVITIGGQNVGDFTLDGSFTANNINSLSATIDLLDITSEISVPSLLVSSNATISELTVDTITNLNDLIVTGNSNLANTTITNLTVTSNSNVGNLTSSGTIQANNVIVTGNSAFESIAVNNFEVTGVFNVETIGITANTVFQNIQVTGNTFFASVYGGFGNFTNLEVGTLDVQTDAFFNRIESANNILTSVTANTINVSNLSVSANTSLTRLTVSANTSMSGALTVSGNTSLANTTLTNTTVSSLSITGTGALKLPSGVTAERPAGVAGHIRFNNTLTQFEGFDGTSWGVISGLNVSDDTTTNETRYITFVSSTSGTTPGVTVSSSKLYYNPSTGTLNATEFNSLSDETLKSEMIPIENALSLVSAIDGISFIWKDTGKKSYGVSAQKLEQIIPDIVSNGEYKTVNYNGLIAVMLQAIKELQSQIDILKNKY